MFLFSVLLLLIGIAVLIGYNNIPSVLNSFFTFNSAGIVTIVLGAILTGISFITFFSLCQPAWVTAMACVRFKKVLAIL